MISQLTAITLVAAVALAGGLGLTRLRQPAIVGYILAGVILGPSGLGLVAETEIVQLLAELGVLMLLFLVGMEVSLRAFRRIYKTAVACALLQALGALVVAFGLGWILDWPVQRSVLLGFVLALSSTAVAIKLLEEIGELRTETGRVTVGVLIAQDLMVVPMLLVLESLGPRAAPDLTLLVRIVVAVSVIVGLVAYLGQRPTLEMPLSRQLRSRHDVAPLATMVFCFGLATLSGLIGLSPAFGAFVAGLVIGASTDRRRAIHAMRPIESILMMAFFMSIGLLIDVRFVTENIGTIALLLASVVVLKSIGNVVILRALGEPWKRAIPAGVMMAQIGEFSFVLAAAGLSTQLISPVGYQTALAVIALSLLISPLWASSARRIVRSHHAPVQGLGEGLQSVYRQKVRLDLVRALKDAVGRRIAPQSGSAETVAQAKVVEVDSGRTDDNSAKERPPAI